MKQWKADLGLLFVALIWGSTFVLVKNAIAITGTYNFLTLRFSLAFLFLFVIFFKRIRNSRREELLAGAWIGIFLFAGYAFQTLGLQWTTASKAGFITGLYVVLVPMLSTLFLRRLPSSSAIIGVVLATVGLGFLSINDNLSLNKGDLLVLACAFSFAIHIILVGKYAPKMDTSVLTTIQIGVSALGSWIFRLTAETFPVTTSPYVIVALLITGIMATALAFSLQNLAQKFTTPTHTALIFTMEPVFAALFAYLLAAERLTLRGWIGAILILLGMISAEVKLSKLLSRRRPLVTEED